MNDHTLAAEYINAGYNHKTILSDVSVTIPKNKISVILGANGCGKSTKIYRTRGISSILSGTVPSSN